MTTVALLILAAAGALGLHAWLRVPSVPAAIAAGVALRALGAPLDEALLREGALLAATFLLFALGAEVDRRDLRGYGRTAVVVAALHLLVIVALATILALALGLGAWTTTYLVLAVSSSSTLVALELLRRRERFFEPAGRLVAAFVVVQDAFVIAALAVLSLRGAGTSGALLGLSLAAGIVVATALISRFVAPRVLLRASLSDEERLLFILALLFAFVGAAELGSLPLVFGAYAAGRVLSSFPVGAVVRGQLSSLADFFTFLFLVSLGALVSLPQAWDLLAETLFLVALLILSPVALVPAIRRAGMTVRASLEAATLVAQAGELAIVVVLLGAESGHIDSRLVGTVVVVVVVTISLVPLTSSDLFISRLTRLYPFRGGQALPVAPRDHVLLVGGGETGRAIAAQLKESGTTVVVIDEDPAVVERLQRGGVLALRGDGADPDVLAAAGASRARAILSTMRRAADNDDLLARHKKTPVLVRTFSPEDGDRVRARGGHPVIEAELATEAVVDWRALHALGPPTSAP